ncbi:MAG: anhydro-N-acetylmuramic acid kinase, partial [Candidatus Eremiobacteraeota bacterium]|nr:anhydro-N-acetylmuramic acid kinase [Candidatus Eremiobacteraeota bacterium]
MIAVGLMSGTSLDGIDAALVDIRPSGNGYAVELLDFAIVPFSRELANELPSALPPRDGSVPLVAKLQQQLGHAYADAAVRIAGAQPVSYVAMHGQTVYHDGEQSITLQLGSPYFIRDRMHTTVCYDFRSADCALGGHGAPLVPYVDALLLASAQEDRVALNLGGIANITCLRRGTSMEQVIAFDSGPGNMLIDAFVQQRSGGALQFDGGGKIAARGAVDNGALMKMLRDPYFDQAPPKSTGRERFGAQFLTTHEDVLGGLSPQDGAATLTALTAHTVADAIRANAPSGARIFVSGGGARNLTLISALQERLCEYRVEPSAEMSLPGDAKEALAFAILGYETLRGRPAN